MLFHTAKVMGIAWSPNSAYIVSGSIDTNVIVWNVASGERDEIRGSVPFLEWSVYFYPVSSPSRSPSSLHSVGRDMGVR